MFKKKKTISPASEITEMYNKQISKRNKYYADLICDLYKSQAQSLSGSLYLDKSDLYGYYKYDDRVIVFCNKEVSDILKEKGIDTWNDSAGGLIVNLKK